MKFYKVILSASKTEVIIDQEDFDKITSLISTGQLIKVKQGIINPSFIVAIVPHEMKAKEIVKGYVDKERGVYIETGRELVNPLVEDKFNNQLKIEK